MNDETVLTIGDAEEVEISSRRQDGSLRPFVTIWIVRVGDRLFVRSAYGARNGWFRARSRAQRAQCAPEVSSST